MLTARQLVGVQTVSDTLAVVPKDGPARELLPSKCEGCGRVLSRMRGSGCDIGE
jgi:hypothetical protein